MFENIFKRYFFYLYRYLISFFLDSYFQNCSLAYTNMHCDYTCFVFFSITLNSNVWTFMYRYGSITKSWSFWQYKKLDGTGPETNSETVQKNKSKNYGKVFSNALIIYSNFIFSKIVRNNVAFRTFAIFLMLIITEHFFSCFKLFINVR